MLKTLIPFWHLVLSMCANSEKKKHFFRKIDCTKIVEAFSYCKKNGFDTFSAFFVDMSIHSGKINF